MKTWDDILYSTEIARCCSLVLIDGECVKNREGDTNPDKEYIDYRVKNHKNVLIQNERSQIIYCQEDLEEYILHIINRYEHLKVLKDRKIIQINPV